MSGQERISIPGRLCLLAVIFWNAFAGGFLLNARSACLPLVIQVGNQRTTVRIGIGGRC
jgi:hypothetical protein